MSALVSSTEFWIGLGFVALFAVLRFHEDDAIRAETTTIRYVNVALLYVGCVALLFGATAMLLTLVHGLPEEGWSEILASLGVPVPADGSFSPPMVAALMLTVLLPKLPYLQRFDGAIISGFQRLASLSAAASKLSSLLQTDTLALSNEEQARIKSQMQEEGFKEGDVRFEKDKSPQHCWTRIYVYCDQVLQWRDDPNYSAFVKQFEAQHDALCKRYSEFRDKAKHCFRLRRLGFRDPSLCRAVEDCKREYERQMKRLLLQTTDFASRGVLFSYPTCTGQRAALRRLGISGHWQGSLSIHNFALMFLILLVTFIGGFMVMDAVFDLSSDGRRLVLLPVTIATNYCIAILLAVLSKRLVPPGTAAQHRPWAVYLGSGILAAACGSVLTIFYHAIASADLAEGVRIFSERKFWWMVMPLATAIVTAYMTDNVVTGRSKQHLRLREGGIQALCTAAAAGFAMHMMNADERVAFAMLLGGIIGFLIGYLVPTWYRGVAPDEAQTPAPAPALDEGMPRAA